MGKMMNEDDDWSADIAKLAMPVLLVVADNDSVSQKHVAEFFALLPVPRRAEDDVDVDCALVNVSDD
jgi:hypothetical protein